MNENAKKLEEVFNAEESSLSLTHTCIDAFVHDIGILLTYDYEYPGYQEEDYLSFVEQVEGELYNIFAELKVEDKEAKVEEFMSSLPEIRRLLNTSIEAIYQGDPAAISKQQVVLMYPGFAAILYYRVAHMFLKLGLPLAARYLSEYAHSNTGIDINPGAEIGEYFFIDMAPASSLVRRRLSAITSNSIKALPLALYLYPKAETSKAKNAIRQSRITSRSIATRRYSGAKP